MWIPKNKKTGQEYPAITGEQKAEWLNDPYIKARYTFRQVEDAPIKKATTTVAVAKKAADVDTTLKEPFEAKRVVTATGPVPDEQ